MRFVLSVSIFISLLFVSACPKLTNSASESSNNPTVSKTSPTLNLQNQSLPQSSETPIPKLEFTPTEPMVWVGSISARESTQEIDKTFYLSNGTIDDSPKYSKIGMTTDVDIFNCAGYLMSGKAQKRGDFGWKFEMMPGTVAADAIEKMKQCDSSLEKESEGKKL